MRLTPNCSQSTASGGRELPGGRSPRTMASTRLGDDGHPEAGRLGARRDRRVHGIAFRADARIDGHGDSISAVVRHTYDLSLASLDKTYDVITVPPLGVLCRQRRRPEQEATCHSNRPPDAESLGSSTVAAAAAAGLLVLSGCSPSATGDGEGKYGFTEAEQVADSEITVWVDASREPAVTAFEEAYPDIPIKLETYDGNAGGSGSFQSKITLMDQAGEGWPDVVFSTQQNDAIWASKQTANGEQGFAAPLNKGFLDQDFLDGFAAGSLDFATIDGTVYGLRNDLAPDGLLLQPDAARPVRLRGPHDVGGVRRTGRQARGRAPRVHPRQHGRQLHDLRLLRRIRVAGVPVARAGGLPLRHRATRTRRTSRRSSTACSPTARSCRTASSAPSSPRSTPTSSSACRARSGTRARIFQGGLAMPAGQIGVAPPLSWEGGEVAAGNVGGGQWYASSHSKNLEAVKTFLEFVTSADEFQVEASSGLPGLHVGRREVARQAGRGGLLRERRLQDRHVGCRRLRSGTAGTSPSWSPETAWAKVVIPGIAAGETVESLLPAWQKELENEATVNGYTVK